MRHDKISAGLLLVQQDYQTEAQLGLMLQMRSLGVVSAPLSPKPPRSVIFIYCDENADLSHLNRYGVRINQSTGRVRTAILPLESLDPVSEDPAVYRLKPSRYLRPLMDVAATKVNLPQFKADSKLTGKGVVIGVVDTGIDPNHPAFTGRILRIWDQTLSGPGVTEGTYGLEVSGANLSVSRDEHAHGTHVAGISAGALPPYTGVAPEAELVIVKTDMQDAHIADGIRYIFRVARELGRPAVVNLSLGGHADAHDGSDSLSQIINAESGPGRIVCCAAGNEGNDNIHGQTVVPKNAIGTMRFQVPSNAVQIAWLNAWYPGNCQFEVSVRSPWGFVTPFQKIITEGNPVREYMLPDARIQIVTPGPDPLNRDHNFFVQIRSSMFKPTVKSGVWQLRVRNTSNIDGRLDVWTLDPSGAVMFSGTSIQDAMKIGSPGASESAITVASYTTRNKWTDVDGKPREVGLAVDTISEFSSEGPLRNGEQKPDVAAPGAMIVSALSADSRMDRSSWVNNQYVTMAGTSMATPLITGVVALLLQSDPTLTPEVVKERLRESGSIPGKAPGTFDPKWGYGLIDALKL